MSKRWNELDYYKEGQTLYGRDEEIQDISNGIERNIQTVIYGQSGVGKSSLLFAGVFPKLRKMGFFPVFIRLGAISPQDYIKTIKDIVIKEAQTEYPDLGKCALDYSIKDNDIHNNDDLWSFFHSTEFSDNKSDIYIPVLVFDQFEEILNDKNTYEYAQQLLLELYTLMDNTRIIPDNCIQYSNFRVVLSLREDYLYCLEELIDKFNLSELRYNRYRIKWLSKQNARKVILNTFGESLSPENSDEICNSIIDKTTNESGDISTIYLSLICSILDIKYDGSIIDASCLNYMDDYIYKYYNQKMEVVSYKAKKYLEQHLTTPDGRRNSLDFNMALRSGQVTFDELDLLIHNRLLRKVSLTGNSRIEFIHDIIAKMVVKKTYNVWYYVKKTFKERHNIAGTASKNEFAFSYIFLFVSFVIAIFISIFISEMYQGNKCLLILARAFLFYYYIKLSLSLLIRRAHDVGLSGWNILSYKLYDESAIFPYTPMISYHYCQSLSIFDNFFCRINKKSQIRKLGINKYEYWASIIRSLKPLYWIFVFTYIGLKTDVPVSIIFFLNIICFSSLFAIVGISIAKRLNYLNINPWYILIPLYNLYLFFICFKNDTSSEKLYTNKFLHIISPSFIGIYLYLAIVVILYIGLL